MNFKKQIIGLAMVITLSACGTLPSPGETIQPPQNNNTIDEHANEISKALPDQSKLLPKNSLTFSDIDQDGIDEAVAVYEHSNQKWAALLREKDDKWNMIWKTKASGFNIDLIQLADLTGNGRKELLLGWTIGASAENGLEIYQWKNDSYELFSDQITYNKIEVDDMPSYEGSDGKSEIAVWKKGEQSSINVEIVRWNGTEFEPAKELIGNYFKKVESDYKVNHEEYPSHVAIEIEFDLAVIKITNAQSLLEDINEPVSLNDELFFSSTSKQIASAMVNVEKWTRDVLSVQGNAFYVNQATRELIIKKLEKYYSSVTAKNLVDYYYPERNADDGKGNIKLYHMLESEFYGILHLLDVHDEKQLKSVELENNKGKLDLVITGAIKETEDFYMDFQRTFLLVKPEGQHTFLIENAKSDELR